MFSESCIVRNSQSQPCLHIQICIECTVFPELKKFTELHRCVGSICFLNMSSVIKTNASALREKNDRDFPRNSLNVNSKRGSPVSENEHEKDDALYAKWKLWLISHYQFKYKSTTAIRRIVEHSTSEKENFESGKDGISPDVLGKHPLGALAWNLNRDKMYFPSGGVSCCQRVNGFKWTNQISDTTRWVTTVVAGSVTSIFGKPNRQN